MKLSAYETHAKDRFVSAVETLLLDLDAESVGRIAYFVGKYGAECGGANGDAVVVECLRIIVDNHCRKSKVGS